MKHIVKFLAVLFIMLSLSCTDKKEEQEVKEMVNEIESVEAKVDSLSIEVEADADALEEALEDLDDNN